MATDEKDTSSRPDATRARGRCGECGSEDIYFGASVAEQSYSYPCPKDCHCLANRSDKAKPARVDEDGTSYHCPTCKAYASECVDPWHASNDARGSEETATRLPDDDEALAKLLWATNNYALPTQDNVERQWQYLRDDAHDDWRSMARRFRTLCGERASGGCTRTPGCTVNRNHMGDCRDEDGLALPRPGATYPLGHPMAPVPISDNASPSDKERVSRWYSETSSWTEVTPVDRQRLAGLLADVRRETVSSITTWLRSLPALQMSRVLADEIDRTSGSPDASHTESKR